MRLRSIVLNSLLAAGSVTITLGAALLLDRWLELGLRHRLASVLETYIQQAEPIMYVYDNQTGWRLNPRTQYHRASFGPFYGLAGFEPFDAKLRVNAEGFIDRDHYLKTPYYRIAFVGNSWLEAVQLQYHERFPPLTEDFVFRLSEHKKVVEVMNFGLSNAAPAQGYGVIKHFVLKYQPEEVWLFVNSWDVRSNSTFARRRMPSSNANAISPSSTRSQPSSARSCPTSTAKSAMRFSTPSGTRCASPSR